MFRGIDARFTPPKPGTLGLSQGQLERANAGAQGAGRAVEAARVKYGTGVTGLASSLTGVLSSGQNFAQGIRTGDASAIVSGAAGIGQGLFGAGEAAATIAQARAAISGAAQPGSRLVGALAKWGGPIGSAFGVISSATDLFNWARPLEC